VGREKFGRGLLSYSQSIYRKRGEWAARPNRFERADKPEVHGVFSCEVIEFSSGLYVN